jgi:hypothetical protein
MHRITCTEEAHADPRHFEKTGTKEKRFFDPFVPDVVSIRAWNSPRREGRRLDDLPSRLPLSVVLELQSEYKRHGYLATLTATSAVIRTSSRLLISVSTGNRRVPRFRCSPRWSPTIRGTARRPRSDLNSILFLMTPAETKRFRIPSVGRSGTWMTRAWRRCRRRSTPRTRAPCRITRKVLRNARLHRKANKELQRLPA